MNLISGLLRACVVVLAAVALLAGCERKPSTPPKPSTTLSVGAA